MSTVEMLVYLIRRGVITIDRVAPAYRAEVDTALLGDAN